MLNHVRNCPGRSGTLTQQTQGNAEGFDDSEKRRRTANDCWDMTPFGLQLMRGGNFIFSD
jgi:hypothetical protein